MRHFIIFILLFSFLNAENLSLQAMKSEKRHAFVISNGSYEDSPITTAINDAQEIKAFLEKLNFDIVYLENASKRKIIKGLRDFNSKMGKGDVSLLYFIGHSIQVKNKNYLIPIEASIESDYHVLYEAIDLDAIIKKMRMAENRLNIIMIDSSHPNPFGSRFHTERTGLAVIKTDKNIDLLFAAAPNKIVQPYPFTQKLISILSRKGVSNADGFKQFQKQFKQSYFQLSDEVFYFNLPNTLLSKEEKLWIDTLALNSIPAYETYLANYPKGKYTAIAQSNLAQLNKASLQQQNLVQIPLEKSVDESNQTVMSAPISEPLLETGIASDQTAALPIVP